MSANKLRKRAAGRSPRVECEPAGEYVSISSEYVTRRFACALHEIDLFAPIDGEALDAANPKHRALMSYRTLLYRLREARSRISAFERVRYTREFGALNPEMRQAQRARADIAARERAWAGRAQSALWRELDSRPQVPLDLAFVTSRCVSRAAPVLHSPQSCGVAARWGGRNANAPRRRISLTMYANRSRSR